MEKDFFIEWRMVSVFMENAYLVADKSTGEGYFIDPGDNAAELIALAEENKIKPIAVLNTHAHIDHIAAVAEIKKHFGIKFYLHKEDEIWLDNLARQSRLFGVADVERPSIDEYLKEGDTLPLGRFSLKVIHTPGHSAGGVCFYIEKAGVLISGDTLFEGSIGRTDFPGGNYDLLISKIKKKLFLLPDETKVYSGHGNPTTVGKEKKSNPFLQ